VCGASGACAPIASEDCVPRFEPRDLERDDTVWIGAMFPTKGPAADEFGAMNVDAVDFARREIAAATRAFDGPQAAQSLPRIGLVVCDDSGDAPRAARTARHLVYDVGAPAILGFRSGQEVTDLAESLLLGRGVLTVATLTSSPLITRIPQPADKPRMVWRTTYNVDATAEVASRVIEEAFEPRARAPMRVTLLRSDVPSALSFAEKLYRELHFNGKSALENGAAYSEVTFGAGELSASEIARLADRVVSAHPSVVVLIGDASTTTRVMERVEARTRPPATRPTYLAILYTAATFAPFIGANADRRHRVYSINSISSAMNARFVIRFNETHERKVTPALNGGPSYDAFYLLAYGAFATSGPITGERLAASFGRLVGPGPAIDVGPTNVFDGLAALARGGSIDLQGTQSGLDFDLATGDEPSDFAVVCSAIGPGGHGRVTGEDLESGLAFSAKARKLQGTIRCP
jgi:ABC-type branched-subunit amino acid transport system substrate-binding protein